MNYVPDVIHKPFYQVYATYKGLSEYNRTGSRLAASAWVSEKSYQQFRHPRMAGAAGLGPVMQQRARKRLKNALTAAEREQKRLVQTHGFPVMAPGYQRTGGFYGRFDGRTRENKFFDTSLTFDFQTTSEVPPSGQLALIPQGTSQNTRIGRKVTIHSI